MEESKIAVTEVDYATQFKEQNIQQALFYIRQLKVHCVLFVPGNDIPEGAKALIYSQMLSIAELYKPKTAVL